MKKNLPSPNKPFLLSHTGDKLSFAAGLAVLPSFLLHSDPFIKLIQTVFFALLLLASRNTIRFLLSAGIFVSIAAVHLLQPYGAVLFSLGRITITEGALKLGVTKASTLIGLIFLSRFFIRTTVRLPGKIGRLLGLMFYYFEKITELWKTIDKKPLFSRLDELLFALSGEEASAGENHAGKEQQSTPLGTVLLSGIIAISWILFFIAL